MFAGNNTFSSIIDAEGYTTFTCQSFNPDEAISQLKSFNFSWLNEKSLEENYLEQVKAINLYKPAAVIGDAMPTLKMAAEHTGTYYISLMNGYMTKHYSGCRTLPKNHPVGTLLNWLPDNAKHYFTIKGEKIAFAQIHKPFKKLRDKYKLSPQEDYLDEMEGDYNLICDLPEIFPLKSMPKNYHLIGPLIYNRSCYNNCGKINIDKTKQTIFVSMGSSGNWANVSFLNDEYFRKYNIICAGDKQRIINALHITHVDFIAAAEILPVSDLVICHGGNGTIYQALLYEVPLLCIPFHFEQEWNSNALASIGLAATINTETLKADHRKLIAECISAKHFDLRKKIKTLINQIASEQPGIVEILALKITASSANMNKTHIFNDIALTVGENQ